MQSHPNGNRESGHISHFKRSAEQSVSVEVVLAIIYRNCLQLESLVFFTLVQKKIEFRSVIDSSWRKWKYAAGGIKSTDLRQYLEAQSRSELSTQGKDVCMKKIFLANLANECCYIHQV